MHLRRNPSGAGIAGFVDFISFWNFSAQLAGDTSAFLTQEHNTKAVGFSKTIDAKHAFSMSTHYPAALAGTDKIDVSVNATLDVLKTVEVWRGGTGDGAKEKLTLMMMQNSVLTLQPITVKVTHLLTLPLQNLAMLPCNWQVHLLLPLCIKNLPK